MTSNRALQININIAYYLLIIFSPLSWVSLVDIGDSSIKFVHLSLIPLVFSLFFKSYRTAFVKFFKFNRLLIGFFILLMLMNFISLSVDTNIDSFSKSMTYIYKNIFYLTLALFFGGMMLILIDSPGFYKKLSITGFVCVIVFVTVASVTFSATGGNFSQDLIKFFFAGDIDGLRRDLYRTIFVTGRGTDEEVQTNLINSLTGSFIIVHFTSLYAYHNIKEPLYKIISVFTYLFSFFFVISSISRSNILALLFGYLIYWGCEIIYKKNIRKIYQLSATLITGLCIILIFWEQLKETFSDTSEMYSERFGELGSNIRLSLNAEAMSTFTATPMNFMFGKGSGAVLSDGHAVHNFVIGSAYQAGIFGLILSILFYAGLIFVVIKHANAIKYQKSAFVISALMSIPVLRMMESGDAGSPTLQEWFCITFFLGYVIKKRDFTKQSNDLKAQNFSAQNHL